MVTHSSILAWRIPWTNEPGGLQVGYRWATLLSKKSDMTKAKAWSSVKCSKTLFCLSFEVELDPCPKATLLFLDCSSLVSNISSVSWLATLGVWSLGLREGPGGWSLFFTNKKWGTARLQCPAVPQGPVWFQSDCNVSSFHCSHPACKYTLYYETVEKFSDLSLDFLLC